MQLSNRIEKAALIRSKCYSLKLENGGSMNKCKGGKKSGVEAMRFELFRSVLEGPGECLGMQSNLRSFDHRIYRVNIQKRLFSSFEDKVRAHNVSEI